MTVQAVTELDNKALIAIRQSFNGIVQCVARIVVLSTPSATTGIQTVSLPYCWR
ncbi:TPA: hypothetical protein ACHG3B_004800 [Escherichia coli]